MRLFSLLLLCFLTACAAPTAVPATPKASPPPPSVAVTPVCVTEGKETFCSFGGTPDPAGIKAAEEAFRHDSATFEAEMQAYEKPPKCGGASLGDERVKNAATRTAEQCGLDGWVEFHYDCVTPFADDGSQWEFASGNLQITITCEGKEWVMDPVYGVANPQVEGRIGTVQSYNERSIVIRFDKDTKTFDTSGSHTVTSPWEEDPFSTGDMVAVWYEKATQRVIGLIHLPKSAKGPTS
jgi:hypothetical protein